VVCVKAGARRDKPSRPRYDDDMWDPSQVLDYWRANPPRSIADKRACAVSLLMLAIYCRPSDLARFSIAHCSIAGNQLRYRIRGPKEAKNESFLTPVQFLDFMPEESEEASYRCAARALCAYWDSISHREKDESSGRGIIWSLAPKTANGPLFPVGPECLSNVMHNVMRRAGVDPKFTGGSARSAGSSHALNSGLDFTSVLSRGRWPGLRTGSSKSSTSAAVCNTRTHALLWRRHASDVRSRRTRRWWPGMPPRRFPRRIEFRCWVRTFGALRSLIVSSLGCRSEGESMMSEN